MRVFSVDIPTTVLSPWQGVHFPRTYLWRLGSGRNGRDRGIIFHIYYNVPSSYKMGSEGRRKERAALSDSNEKLLHHIMFCFFM